MRSGGRLQLKVCSARNLSSDRTLYPFVQVVAGPNYKEKTANRKCGAGQKNVYWNQKFVIDLAAGEVVKIEVKNKETLFGPPSDIGRVDLTTPDSPDELHDVWLPILDARTLLPIGAELHCVLQFEPAPSQASGSSRSPSTLGSLSYASKGRSLPAVALTQSTIPVSSSASEQSLTAVPPPVPPKTSRKLVKRASSDFDGHAAALTLNELMDALENIKATIESAGADVKLRAKDTQTEDPQRLQVLRSAKRELEDIKAQIEEQSSLSEEWQKKLIDLSQSYANDLTMLLSTEAWRDVTRRSMAFKNQAQNSSESQQILLQQRGQHREVTKEFTLDSIELFDALIDHGFSMQVHEQGTKEPAVSKGVKVQLEYTAYIWDSANTLAVSYEGSDDAGTFQEFTVGDEDIPLGLSLALEGTLVGTSFSLCLSPTFAYGEDGTDTVPPNTHLLIEGRITGVIAENAKQSVMQTYEVAAADPDDLVRKSRASLRFPARQNRVSLSAATTTSKLLEASGSVSSSIQGEREPKPPPLPPRPSSEESTEFVPPYSPISAVPQVATSRPSSALKPAMEPVAAVQPPVLEVVQPVVTTPSSTGSVKAWLEEIGFQTYYEPLHQLGVEELADLEHVLRSDLENMGMKLIQVRKFASHLSKLGIPHSLTPN